MGVAGLRLRRLDHATSEAAPSTGRLVERRGPERPRVRPRRGRGDRTRRREAGSGGADHRFDRVEPLVQELAVPVAQLAAVALAAHQLLALDRAQRRGGPCRARRSWPRARRSARQCRGTRRRRPCPCSPCPPSCRGASRRGWRPAARRRRRAPRGSRRPEAACPRDPAAAAARSCPARRRGLRPPGRGWKRGRRNGSWKAPVRSSLAVNAPDAHGMRGHRSAATARRARVRLTSPPDRHKPN